MTRSSPVPTGVRMTLLGLAAALLTGAAFAHDFWISPSAYRCDVGEAVDLTLLVGHAGRAEPYARNPKHLKRFWMVDPSGAASDVGPVPPREDADDNGGGGERKARPDPPAGRVTPEAPGVHVVGYRSHPSEIELEAKKFESYLKEEGLDSIIAERAARGESSRPGRELFSRSCKTLLLVGDEGAARDGFDRLIGLTVEITPRADPFELRPGDALTVVVHHDGAPAPGVRVDAEQWTSADRIHLTGVTDERGRAAFELSRAGVWLITTTRMERAAEDAGVEWESVWGSLTLEVRAAEEGGG